LRILALLLLLLSSGCSSFLYYPSRELFIDPHKLKIAPENIRLEIEPKQSVLGWYFKSPFKPAKAVILFFHGNGENRSTHFMTLYRLVEQGYDLAIFDYPGYGETNGTPTPKNTVQMGRAALRYIHQREPGLPLVVYGQSLGGAIALRSIWEVREELKPKLIIIDSSFASYRSVSRRVLAGSAWTWLLQPFGWLVMSDKWAPGKRISEIKGSTMVVIHSKTDEIVSLDNGLDIFKYANEPKQLWLKESGTHMGTYAGPEGDKIRQLLLKTLTDLR